MALRNKFGEKYFYKHSLEVAVDEIHRIGINFTDFISQGLSNMFSLNDLGQRKSFFSQHGDPLYSNTS